jgi:hypothetical protein
VTDRADTIRKARDYIESWLCRRGFHVWTTRDWGVGVIVYRDCRRCGKERGDA